jgi:hypothetical protein
VELCGRSCASSLSHMHVRCSTALENAVMRATVFFALRHAATRVSRACVQCGPTRSGVFSPWLFFRAAIATVLPRRRTRGVSGVAVGTRRRGSRPLRSLLRSRAPRAACGPLALRGRRARAVSRCGHCSF